MLTIEYNEFAKLSESQMNHLARLAVSGIVIRITGLGHSLDKTTGPDVRHYWARFQNLATAGIED